MQLVLSLGVGTLLVLPIALRTFMGAILPVERSYDKIEMSLLIMDPSIIAFSLSGLVVFIVILRDFGYISNIFKSSLLMFLCYTALGTLFALFTEQKFLGIFIGIEMIIYLSIAAICIGSYKSLKTGRYEVIENSIYVFFSFLVFIAIVDLLLPGTNPYSVTSAGRQRFDGELLPLIANQWAATSAVALIIALSHVLRGGIGKYLHIVIAFMAAVVLISTGTRGALLAFVVGFLVFSMCMRKRIAKIHVILLVFLAVLSSSFLVVLDVGSIAGEGARHLRLDNVENTTKLGGRTEYWDKAFSILMENPLVGQGIGLRKRETGLSKNMHNFFLEAWVGAGILGAMFFCLGLAFTAKRLYSVVSKYQTASHLQGVSIHYTASTAMAILAYLITHGLVESSIAGVNNFSSVPLLYCVIVGQGLWQSRRGGQTG